ncbi:MAG: hypothetical protein Q4B94_01870 [Pseudomonadota bacterium]|nr:hypothetical protein [Pseudomonadota bacterium]
MAAGDTGKVVGQGLQARADVGYHPQWGIGLLLQRFTQCLDAFEFRLGAMGDDACPEGGEDVVALLQRGLQAALGFLGLALLQAQLPGNGRLPGSH